MTKIKDLKDGMKKVNCEGYVIEKQETREVISQSDYQPYNVATAYLGETSQSKDADTVKLTLWNEDIDRVRLGDKVKIENGYVTSFRGEIQLNIGKYGILSII